MMKIRKPSPAVVIATGALVFAGTGGAVAATQVGTNGIQNGAVTNHKLGNDAVGMNKLDAKVRFELAQHTTGSSRGNGSNGSNGTPGVNGSSGANGNDGAKGNDGANGNAGGKGDKGDAGNAGAPGGNGTNGADGTNGRDGANPATPVVSVPAINAGDTNGGNPDSGASGDAGWYFSGSGTGGSAKLVNGELDLQGNGVDSNTEQGGIGIAHAYNVPLSQLDTLSYQWHVNEVNATQAPSIHVTVTGLKANSKFASGFANLDYTPGINGITPSMGVQYQSDTMAAGSKWFSTTNPSISAPGGQNSPETLAQFASDNPSAVIVQISVDGGGTSGGTGTFDAGADNLVLGLAGNGSLTRYDFGG